jgi:hypothetical protein
MEYARNLLDSVRNNEVGLQIIIVHQVISTAAFKKKYEPRLKNIY